MALSLLFSFIFFLALVAIAIAAVFAYRIYENAMHPIFSATLRPDAGTDRWQLSLTNGGQMGAMWITLETLFPNVDENKRADFKAEPRLALEAGHIGPGRTVTLLLEQQVVDRISAAGHRMRVRGRKGHRKNEFTQTILVLEAPLDESPKQI